MVRLGLACCSCSTPSSVPMHKIIFYFLLYSPVTRAVLSFLGIYHRRRLFHIYLYSFLFIFFLFALNFALGPFGLFLYIIVHVLHICIATVTRLRCIPFVVVVFFFVCSPYDTNSNIIVCYISLTLCM